MVPDHFLGGKLIAGGIPAKKIWRNPNPLFVDQYKAVGTHKGYVLFIGRLVAQKGILTLVKSMKLTGQASRLVIVGQGELAGRVMEDVEAGGLSDRVSCLGPRWGDELAGLIADCAAVVIPSEWYDNLPMILCRSNAMGKTVIASRINGLPEYITEGENGFLFQPGNPTELADLIDRILALSTVEYRVLSGRSRTWLAPSA